MQKWTQNYAWNSPINHKINAFHFIISKNDVFGSSDDFSLISEGNLDLKAP